MYDIVVLHGETFNAGSVPSNGRLASGLAPL